MISDKKKKKREQSSRKMAKSMVEKVTEIKGEKCITM